MLTVTTGMLQRKVAKIEAEYQDPVNVRALPLHFATVGPSYRNLPKAPAFELQAVKPAAVTLPPLDLLSSLLFSTAAVLAVFVDFVRSRECEVYSFCIRSMFSKLWQD
jgi:hypothetical protein